MRVKSRKTLQPSLDEIERKVVALELLVALLPSCDLFGVLDSMWFFPIRVFHVKHLVSLCFVFVHLWFLFSFLVYMNLGCGRNPFTIGFKYLFSINVPYLLSDVG